MRILWIIVCLAAVPCAALAQSEPQFPKGDTPESVFTEAWLVIRSAFYTKDFNGADWEAVREELLPRVRASKDSGETSLIINEALSRLKASHTHHYTQDQREYYELLDVFYPEGVPPRKGSRIHTGPVEYVGVGLVTAEIDGRRFVADVYGGGPADDAGILVGDELISVDGRPWEDIAPFRGREEKQTIVVIQRTEDHNSRKSLIVRPRVIHPREAFLEAITRSARVYERDGRKIGYARIRSYAHKDYHERLKELIQSKFGECDGLVIDIRGGWGGASPQYMDIFNPYAPDMDYISRDGEHRKFSTTWRKPVAMIVDGGSRSGKEVLAFAFKEHKIGILVGEKTAGAVLAGTPRPLADGSLLYVAVNDVVVDGARIEGVGVEPDIAVKRNLPYCGGEDEQVKAAVDAVARKCGAR